MRLINRLLVEMIDGHHARVYPSCLTDPAVGLSARKADTIAAYLNLQNSTKLKKWVGEYYLPYCKRKAKSDVEEIVAETSWIWQDLQLRGIAASVATLLVLLIFYLELFDLKAAKIAAMKPASEEEDTDEMKEIRAMEIQSLNTRAEYLLFPLTMTISIVGLLLIPVTSQTEIANITPGKSFWMMNVPSLHLPDVVDEVIEDVPITEEETDDTPSADEEDPIDKGSGLADQGADNTGGVEPEVKVESLEQEALRKDIQALTEKLNSLNFALYQLTGQLKKGDKVEGKLQEVSKSLEGVRQEIKDLPKIVEDAAQSGFKKKQND